MITSRFKRLITSRSYVQDEVYTIEEGTKEYEYYTRIIREICNKNMVYCNHIVIELESSTGKISYLGYNDLELSIGLGYCRVSSEDSRKFIDL